MARTRTQPSTIAPKNTWDTARLETAPAIPVAGMAEERSHLVGRVRRLLEGAPFSRGPGRRTVLVGGALVVLASIAAVPGIAPGRQTSTIQNPDSMQASDSNKESDPIF